MRLLPILICLSLWCSCNEDGESWAGCCGNPPFFAKLGNVEIYVPNIFTPNGDQVNDLFLVRGDSIAEIVAFTIHTRGGQVVFHREHVEANDFTQAWDGTIDGKVIPGQYFVDFTIALTDGSEMSFEAEVCNYPCGLYSTLQPVNEINCGLPIWWECRYYQEGCYAVEPGCFE